MEWLVGPGVGGMGVSIGGVWRVESSYGDSLPPLPPQLCMVSLSLFRTLLNLSCEDVLLQLVLRYLWGQG